MTTIGYARTSTLEQEAGLTAQGRELLRAGLFIRQHEKRMRQKRGSRNRGADDKLFNRCASLHKRHQQFLCRRIEL